MEQMVKDLEMASMRQGRAFLARINHNIPKTLSSMEQMVKDLEMASMRQGRAFLARINHNIPKTLSSMEQMVKDLEDQRGAIPLAAPRFESLILGIVYSAHKAKLQEREEDQEKWGEVLKRLANVTVNELRRPEAITTFT
ncbi:uncharacterized protein ACWYII_042566 [Salvelinus alpinus]